MKWLIALLVALAVVPLPAPARVSAAILTGLLITFRGWQRSLQRRLLIRGTATAKIASAAKGYAELTGRARNALATPLYDPILREPCVWFEVVTQKYDLGLRVACVVRGADRGHAAQRLDARCRALNAPRRRHAPRRKRTATTTIARALPARAS
jgi:hypothetical protein